MFCAIRTPPFPLKNTNGKYTLQTDAMCTYHLKRLSGKQDCWSLDRTRAVELQDGRAPVIPVPQETSHLCHHCRRIRDGEREKSLAQVWTQITLSRYSFSVPRAHLGHRIWSLSRLRCFSLAPSLCWSSAAGEQLWNPGCWIVWGSLSEMLSGETVFRVFATPEINFPLPVSR